jgi:hypothetical protein
LPLSIIRRAQHAATYVTFAMRAAARVTSAKRAATLAIFAACAAAHVAFAMRAAARVTFAMRAVRHAAFPMRALSHVTIAALLAFAPVARATDAVSDWAAVVDRFDRGDMSRYTISILFPAMHDALNAIQPRYARWTPPAHDEPRAAGASPEAAIAAVAEIVLGGLAEGSVAQRASLVAAALVRVPAGEARERGLALGRSVGMAALRRREADGHSPFVQFSTSTRPGRWRPTPPLFGQDVVPTSGPLLFSSPASAALVPPPPAFGSPIYRRDVEEVRRMGGRVGSRRTDAEEGSALFWAQQVSHRGFIDAAVTLLDARLAADRLWTSARVLALLSIGMDDAGVIIWQAKERYSFWRPVTALQEGGFGVTADAEWLPLITTPSFPEYPSGHATDCAMGGTLMTALFGDEVAFTYRSLGTRVILSQQFPSFQAAARDCSLSRIWAGVHFRETEDVSEVIGTAIAREALRRLPPLSRGR